MRHRPFHPVMPVPAGFRRRSRIAAAAAVGGLILALAVGCTSGSTSTSAAAGAASAVADLPAGPVAAGPPSAGSKAGSSAAASPGAAAPAPASSGGSSAAGGKLPDISAGVDAADRQVIHTANVTLNVEVKSTNKGSAADQAVEQDAVNAAAIKVRALASGAGYVSAADGQGTTMSITLQVPAAGYKSAMDALPGIAPIVSRQESTQDVTSQMIDIGSRMQTMTASVNRVRALLSKADKIGDVIAIESELTSREADLESLQRQQAALAGQTALSTITVVLQGSITGVKAAVAPPAPVARSGFLGGLANGWHAFRALVHACLTVVGTLIPFLPVVAVVVIALLIWRRRVRPAAQPVLAASAGDPQPTD